MKTFSQFISESKRVRVLRTAHYTSNSSKANIMRDGFKDSPSTGAYHPDDMKRTVYTTPDSRVGRDYGHARVNMRIVNPKTKNTLSHGEYSKRVKDLVLKTDGEDLQRKAREISPVVQARTAIKQGHSIVRVPDAHKAGPGAGKGSYIMIDRDTANKSIVPDTYPIIRKSRSRQESVEESLMPGRNRRLLGPRGPSKYDMDRLNQRRIDSDRAALRKAGFRRNPSKSDVDFYADNSHHHSTSVITHPNQSSYAIAKTKNKNLGTGLRLRGKVNSTASRVRELKSLRRQLGSDRISRKVHDVTIGSMSPHEKNDSKDLFKRHRSFRQSLYDLPKTLHGAGAKPGDKITGEPAETMFGSKDLKSGKEKRAKLYDKILGKKMNSKTGIIVGTYGESTELDEKYYKPSSKLPSGKTPLQKAIEKREQRQKNISPNSNIKRAQKHSELTDTKVMRGADNKHYDDEPHPDVHIDSYNDDYLTVHHPKSGIEYHVNKLPIPRGKRDVHSIEWTHGRRDSKMSPSERVRIGKAAHDVWKHHVVHRIPHGSILHNSPSSDTKSNTQEKRNKRGDIYKRAGFGDVDSERDQFASLNRPPSPRQKAKGKLQLSPLDANKTKKQLGWDP